MLVFFQKQMLMRCESFSDLKGMSNFPTQIGIDLSGSQYPSNQIVDSIINSTVPKLIHEQVTELYTYPVPILTADGSCSASRNPAPERYSLAKLFGEDLTSTEVLSSNATHRLHRLKSIVVELQRVSQVDWLGIYRTVKGEPDYLLKEAYVGAFSRAEFPLTKEFAEHSNNSTVGLTGRAVLVQSVAAYQGPYYVCDGRVESEFCLPILRGNTVIGIIDAESFNANHFTSQRLADICSVADRLGQLDLLL